MPQTLATHSLEFSTKLVIIYYYNNLILFKTDNKNELEKLRLIFDEEKNLIKLKNSLLEENLKEAKRELKELRESFKIGQKFDWSKTPTSER